MEAIESNIESAIKSAKRRGITGMSLANLFQVTPTLGVRVSPAGYSVLFEESARKVAARLKFDLLD